MNFRKFHESKLQYLISLQLLSLESIVLQTIHHLMLAYQKNHQSKMQN